MFLRGGAGLTLALFSGSLWSLNCDSAWIERQRQQSLQQSKLVIDALAQIERHKDRREDLGDQIETKKFKIRSKNEWIRTFRRKLSEDDKAKILAPFQNELATLEKQYNQLAPSVPHLEPVSWKEFLKCGNEFWTSPDAVRILSNISQLQFKNGIQRGGWSKRSLLSGLEQNSDFDPNLSGNGSDDVSEIMAYAQEKFEGKPPHFLRTRQLLMNSHQVTLDNNFPLIMNLYLKLYEAQPEAFQSSPILRSSFNNGLQFFHRTQYTRDSGDHPSWRGSFPQVVTNQELNTYERRPTFNDHSALNVLDFALQTQDERYTGLISPTQRSQMAKLIDEGLIFIENSQSPNPGDGLWGQQYNAFRRGRIQLASGRKFEGPYLSLPESLKIMEFLSESRELNEQRRKMLNGAIARFDAYLIEGVEIREVRGKKTCINHFKSNPHNVHLYSIWARFTDHKGNPKFVDRRGEVITAEIFMQKSMFELRLSTEENFKAHSGMMAGDIRYQSPKFYRQLYDPRSKVQNKELVAEKFCLAFNNFRKKAPDKVEEYRWTLPAFTNGSPSHWVSTLNKIKSRLNPESRSIVNPNPLANTNVSNGPSSNVHEITMEPIEEIEIQLTPVELITQSPD